MKGLSGPPDGGLAKFMKKRARAQHKQGICSYIFSSKSLTDLR
jgi:hypothetical protein